MRCMGTTWEPFQTQIPGVWRGACIEGGTNWEAEKLSDAQQKYAALDAWACLKIYQHLAGGKFNPAQSMYKTALEPQG